MKDNVSLSDEISKAVRNILSEKKIVQVDPVFPDENAPSLNEFGELYEPDFMKE